MVEHLKLRRSVFKTDVYTNLITAVSYNRKAFLRKPDELLDISSFFTSENNIIGYVGISKQQFYQEVLN